MNLGIISKPHEADRGNGEKVTNEDNPRIKNSSDAVKQLESIRSFLEEKGHTDAATDTSSLRLRDTERGCGFPSTSTCSSSCTVGLPKLKTTQYEASDTGKH